MQLSMGQQQICGSNQKPAVQTCDEKGMVYLICHVIMNSLSACPCNVQDNSNNSSRSRYWRTSQASTLLLCRCDEMSWSAVLTYGTDSIRLLTAEQAQVRGDNRSQGPAGQAAKVICLGSWVEERVVIKEERREDEWGRQGGGGGGQPLYLLYVGSHSTCLM